MCKYLAAFWVSWAPFCHHESTDTLLLEDRECPTMLLWKQFWLSQSVITPSHQPTDDFCSAFFLGIECHVVQKTAINCSKCCSSSSPSHVNLEKNGSFPQDLSSWWFQRIWKVCSSNWESSPHEGENKQICDTTTQVSVESSKPQPLVNHQLV